MYTPVLKNTCRHVINWEVFEALGEMEKKQKFSA